MGMLGAKVRLRVRVRVGVGWLLLGKKDAWCSDRLMGSLSHYCSFCGTV